VQYSHTRPRDDWIVVENGQVAPSSSTDVDLRSLDDSEEEGSQSAMEVEVRGDTWLEKKCMWLFGFYTMLTVVCLVLRLLPLYFLKWLLQTLSFSIRFLSFNFFLAGLASPRGRCGRVPYKFGS